MSNKQLKDTRFSVLNLSPIVKGGTVEEAFKNSMDLARRAEEWGYNRYWLAEHHNIEGVASSATSVLIGHIAGGTKKSASVPAELCCRTIPRWSLRNNSEPLKRSIPAELI